MRKRYNKLVYTGFYIILISLVATILVPFCLMVINSFKSRMLMYSPTPVWIFRPIIKHYFTIFVEKEYGRYIFNSVIVALGSTGLSLVLGVPAAYVFSRHRLRLNMGLAVLVLLPAVIPPISLAIPLFIFVSKLGLLDTHFALIATHTVFNVALVVWILKNFIDGIPYELDESAKLDGCGNLGIFFRIILPLATTGLVAVGSLVFLLSWNEYLAALILTRRTAKTLPVVIPPLMQHTGTLWGQVSALCLIEAIPGVCFIFFALRYLVKGLAAGSLR